MKDSAMNKVFTAESLLFRPQVELCYTDFSKSYEGKTVLVTGGGGTVGSELCRQIARCNPERIIIFDICENGVYDISQELLRNYGCENKFVAEIGSVRDITRLDELFCAYKPDIVFHAAAHKHVPLMEHNPQEAVKNNVFGTYYTANAAEKYGVKRFILISTDKAVNPASVMGASKLLCETLVRCRKESNTAFSSVRFGNVLCSNGSVIPLFEKQISEGGPVTVTDKRMTRYFMTVSEACRLVMCAGSMAEKGELYVLDMGEPVCIYDLAVKLIKLCGFEPGKDIEIRETGIRPGEKLFEEPLSQNGILNKTCDDRIFVENSLSFSRSDAERIIVTLRKALENGDDIKRVLAGIIPSYTPYPGD